MTGEMRFPAYRGQHELQIACRDISGAFMDALFTVSFCALASTADDSGGYSPSYPAVLEPRPPRHPFFSRAASAGLS